MTTLLVTTMNQPLYDVAGQHLIDTYIEQKIDMPMLVVYEDMDESTFNWAKDRIVLRDIHKKCPVLKDWEEKFSDIIPMRYGGTYPKCTKCAEPDRMWGNHIKGCLNQGFNSRMSRWFRKIVAQYIAATLDYERILFIDCDCVFTRTLTDKRVAKIFDKYDFIYHLGQYRPKKNISIESGLLGYSKSGYDLLGDIFDYYMTGTFQKLPYWADNFVTEHVMNISKYNCCDLVADTKTAVKGQVITQGPFKKFISHNKGSTWRASEKDNLNL